MESGIKIERLYRLPIFWRSNCFGQMISPQCVLREVDGVGIFFYYRGDTEPTDADIRNQLTGRKSEDIYIPADSAAAAICKFYDEWDGAKVGSDQSPEYKAMWIDIEKPILELPRCDRLYVNKNNEFTCGRPDPQVDNNGEYGMCMLGNYTAPDDCVFECFLGYYRHNEAKLVKEGVVEVPVPGRIESYRVIPAVNILSAVCL